MQNPFTLNDLMFFAYSDPEFSEGNRYRNMIETDENLSKKFNTVLRVKRYVAKLKVEPSQRAINNILNYSRALSVIKTQRTGNFSMMLN
ncbi:MAG: hypothetical protein RBR47_02810 [Bacteroidales bacterium]|jgi:hypothetical protein|nr:hypothetical protein [Bacteroidales bacterium]NCU34590.1 hypothetical protein [Candidatus Falkowbacteria bacterium]MDD3130584.1 hypothetical protein [Bacteroidales bacterium]MDD3527462.1 hypothetical protein [Bacteroidales bacterium]MDD4176504.1 hypothetical protein [Bacteroidales bacterium]